MLTPNNELAQSIALRCVSSSSAGDCQGTEAALLAGAHTAGPTTSCCNFSCQYVQKTAASDLFVVKCDVLYFCLKSKKKNPTTSFCLFFFYRCDCLPIYTEEQPCQTGSGRVVISFLFFFKLRECLEAGAERTTLKLSRYVQCHGANVFLFFFPL